MALTDTSKMPFGKYKGQLMQDVPASYLHWLWTNGLKQDRSSDVSAYIKDNLSALQKEHPDGIW
jgi:Putative quorum-sensing-regulated virulence factor